MQKKCGGGKPSRRSRNTSVFLIYFGKKVRNTVKQVKIWKTSAKKVKNWPENWSVGNNSGLKFRAKLEEFFVLCNIFSF